MMRDAIPALLTWLQTFCREEPNKAATLEVRDQKLGIRVEAVAISEVVDIEESIWVPRYGLKGMIDASVQLRCQPVGPHGPMQALQASHSKFQLTMLYFPRMQCKRAKPMSMKWLRH